jgi:hypothetical protein
MKKMIKNFILVFVIVLSLSSCASVQYNKVYPLASYSKLINGYWGDWQNNTKMDYSSQDKQNYIFLVQTSYNDQSLEILVYMWGLHPSQYIAKITIDKRTGKVYDKDWFSYQGTTSSRGQILVPIGFNTDLKTVSCEIRCDKKMQKAIQKNGLYGTINVFYGNGLGNGFTFN